MKSIQVSLFPFLFCLYQIVAFLIKFSVYFVKVIVVRFLSLYRDDEVRLLFDYEFQVAGL